MGTISIGTLMASIGGDISPLKGALGEANNALNKFTDQASKNAEALKNQFRGLTSIGDSMKSVGTKMSIGLTLPLVGIGIAAGKMAMDWQEGMAKINTTAQLPKAGLKALSDQIYKLGVESGADLAKVPQAFEGIISNVGDATLSMEIFKSSLKGAKAGFTEIETVSGALAMSLSAIGKGGASADEVLNTLFAAKRVGAGEFKDFANYIPGLISSGKALGVNYKEVAGTFAYMTAKGNDAASSSMLVQNAFSALGKVDIQAGLQASGVAVFDTEGKMRSLADVMTDVGRVMGSMNDQEKTAWLDSIELKDMQAKQAFMALSSETDKLKEAIKATSNASGELETALSMAENPAQTMAQAMTNLKGIAIGFGNIMLPTINSVISSVSKLMGWIVGLDDTTKKWMIGIGAVVAAIGPLLLGIGSIMTLIPKLKTGIEGLKIAMNFLKANPFILIATAAIALGILIVKLWKNCETFRAVVKYVALSVSSFFQKAWIEIKMGAELMWLGIKTYFTAIPKLAEVIWNTIKRVMKGESIGDAFKDEFLKVTTAIGDEAKGIKSKYQEQLDAIESPDYQKILASEKAVGVAKETGEAARKQLEESFNATSDGGLLNTGLVSSGKKDETKMKQDSTTPFVSMYTSKDQFEKVAAPVGLGKVADSYKTLSNSLKDVDIQFGFAKNSAALFGQPFDENATRAELLKQKIDELTQQGLPANKAAIETLGEEYRTLAAEMKNTAATTVDVGGMMSESLKTGFATMGESLGAMAAGTGTLKSGLQAMLGIVLDFGAEFGKALIAVGVGKLALDSLVKMGPVGAIAAIAAGVALVALVSYAKSTLAGGVGGSGGGEAPTVGTMTSVPALAAGGLAYGPTYAQIGDNPQARFDPEFIAPVSQVGKYLNQNDSGSNIPSYITLQVKGEDLEAILNLRNKRSNNLR